MAYTRQQFIDKIAPMAVEDMHRTSILASLTIAQACLESANGSSGLAVRGNNLFGIKGTYNGQSVTMPTREVIKGRNITINAAFRKYPSWQASITDHSALFTNLSRYKNLIRCTDYKKACRYVQADGYATDPNYAAVLIKLIEQYNLTQYDNEPKEDKQLAEAVSKIIKSGIQIDYNSWKRAGLIKTNAISSLLFKLGGIDSLIKAGIITEKEKWLTGQYSANDARSLIIKYAAKL